MAACPPTVAYKKMGAIEGRASYLLSVEVSSRATSLAKFAAPHAFAGLIVAMLQELRLKGGVAPGRLGIWS